MGCLWGDVCSATGVPQRSGPTCCAATVGSPGPGSALVTTFAEQPLYLRYLPTAAARKSGGSGHPDIRLGSARASLVGLAKTVGVSMVQRGSRLCLFYTHSLFVAYCHSSRFQLPEATSSAPGSSSIAMTEQFWTMCNGPRPTLDGADYAFAATMSRSATHVLVSFELCHVPDCFPGHRCPRTA
jgi:hypothetical protein